jgi:branched-chain amino acid transport system ATP-binding protein
LLDRAGGSLSGGEQQLLALARALAGNPDLLLLDEPTEGIQPSIIDEIAETLVKLRERSGLTIVLVEQNLDFIAAVSQRVLVIRRGQIGGEIPREHLSDVEIVSQYAGVHA